MNIREITNDIYYVGVNDRTTALFEGLWPLPYGVTYNAYVVKGSVSSALIDTVSIDELHAYFTNLRSLDLDSPIEYLVVNHMEPDHSGSIPYILRIFPNIKIVGNKKTAEMIRGFYHVEDEDRFYIIGDGDTLDLGDKTLSFHLIPMVHWPETMTTYVKEDKLMFTGDAFGTFGALSGGVVDTEMDTSLYIEEMYRYYSNIVGKYGIPVQRALAKLKGIELDYICPTHGPVWKERINEVVKIYDDLSAYKSEEGAVIIYGSMYGNTAAVAEKIGMELAAKGVTKIIIHNASTSSMSDMIRDAFRYKILIVGCSTYSMRLFPPVEMFMNAMETREIKNKVFATFSNHTWAKGIVEKKLAEYGDRMKLTPVCHLSIEHSSSSTTDDDVKILVDKILEASVGVK